MKFLIISLLLSSIVFAKGSQPAHTGHILVKLAQNVKSINEFTLTQRFLTSDSLYGLVKIADKSSLDSMLRKLRSQKSVLMAEPNYLYYASVNKDPNFSKLWGLANNSYKGVDINAVKAWSITKGNKNIKIAVIDTGIDYNHPDLKDNIFTNLKEINGKPGIDDDGNGFVDDIHGYDFANNDNDPMDDNGHGTHCAGTIGASHNSIGVAGVMADVSLLPIKFIKAGGSGSLEGAIKAIDYAIKMKVDIMSNSWGGEGASDILEDAIKRANAKGIYFVAAAGNSNSNNDLTPQYPASYKVENVISVASYEKRGARSSFSCYGKNSVHIMAPGSEIYSTAPGNEYKYLSGTSMATPHVAGILGLYLSKNKTESLSVVKDRLNRSSVYDRSYASTIISKGRVDAYNFLKGIYPARPSVPSDGNWKTKNVSIESVHPYPIDTTSKYSIEVPGAKFIRVIIDKFDIEKKYDQLRILDKERNFIDALSSAGTNYISEAIAGDTVYLELMSDISVNRWGFKISKIEYIE